MPISCKFYSFFFFIFIEFLIMAAHSDMSEIFHSSQNILVNCGSPGNSTGLDGREWTGDVHSNFVSSVVSNSATNHPVPYDSVQIFHSQLTYTFHLNSGQKLVRFYFSPASAMDPQLDRSKVIFSVKISSFVLLSNFTPSPSADFFVKEFCLVLEQNQALNITFNPLDDAYGFINGIEILSLPDNLYHTGSGDAALEIVYRLNIGGKSILPTDDSGLFRSWTEDSNFTVNLESTKTITARINSAELHSYVAPIQVYQTGRLLGNRMNLTWKLPIDTGSVYLVRFHFCELQPATRIGDRVFQIFVGNQMVEASADIVKWSNGVGIPVFRDCVVNVSFQVGETAKRNNLLVVLQPKGKSTSILNGLELFKINKVRDKDNSETPIAPARRELTVNQALKSKQKIAISVATILGVMILIVAGFLIFWLCKRSRFTDDSVKSLPIGVCRRFSAEEIRNATNDFDRGLVIGNGGFGRVFKGHIDPKNTPVAIKALKPTSTQGSHEFWTEIEMLSKLRHPHLVSLIGYCNDEHMMILVYDYMANGTLRDHLYHAQNPPLSWKQRLQICIGAARGIKFLHTGAAHCIIHRDIKSSNILLDEEWVAKVSDFGLSRLGPTSISRSHVTTEVKGTFGYLDPEYYFTHHLSAKSDAYSFGVLLFEVLCARPAVDMMQEEGQHSLVVLAKQHFRDGTLDQIIDPNLMGQIAPESLKVYSRTAVKCLRNHKNDRPIMSNVLQKLETALQLQEIADAAAEEGMILESGSEKDDILLNGARTSNNSGCFTHSCPTFWHKNSSPRGKCQFYSEGGRGINNISNNTGKKRRSIRGLKGLFYTVSAYKSLSAKRGQCSDSSFNSSELDFESDEMLMEIMAHQDESQNLNV